ncbi:unnamed protein product [Cunninghamella blakesleeana]
MPYFDGVVTKPPVTPARSNTIAVPSRPPSSPKASSADTITTEERNNYIRVFQSSEPINGVLTSDKATSIFLRSNLPSTTLQHIWDLADTRKSGTLNQTEFIIAMHYISATRNGTVSTLPSTLPDSIYSAATGRLGTSLGRHNTTLRSPIMQHNTGSSLRPNPSLYNHPQPSQQQQSPLLNVSNDEYKKYKVLFQQLASDKGSISGADAVHFFRHSKLPETDLAQIWDLADTRSTGELTQNEFIVAMHLVNRRMAGEPVPTMLPASTFQLSSPMLSNNQLSLPASQHPNNPSSNTSFDLLGLDGPINNVQPTKTVSTTSATSSHFDNAFSIGDQSTAINNNNNNNNSNDIVTTNNNTNKAFLENNLASIQSQIRTENSLIDTLQSQKQGIDNSVKVLEESIEKEKQHLESLKRTVQELEQHVKNQQMKKDNLTRELQTFRQESKHFQQRIDHYRQESKDLENEISELEKKQHEQSSSPSLSGNNNHGRSSTATSPFLTKSTITSPKISDKIPTSPSLNNHNSNNIFSLSTPISDNDLFAKVQDVSSPTLSTTSSHTNYTNTTSNNNHNNKTTIDPFAHQKKVTSPSLNKLKHDSETRYSSSSSSTPNVDISEIEAKFPDLSTMEHDFDVNNHPTDTMTSPKTTPVSPPPQTTTTAPVPVTTTSSTSITKSPSLQQSTLGTGSSIFGISNNNNNNTNSKPSKYGFDLSLFEGTNETSSSSSHQTTSFKDDLTSIFSNTNSPNVSSHDNKTNEENQNQHNNNNNNSNSNNFDSLFGVSSSTNPNSSSPQKQQEKPISFADAFF